MHWKTKKTHGHRPQRAGAAAVEFAVVAPMFVAILLGTIEACSMIFLRQTTEMAAFEAARVSIVTQSTTAQVETAAKAVLDTRKVKDYTVSITPKDFQNAPYGTFVRVEVRVPCEKNSLIPSLFYKSKEIVGSVDMMKEY